MQVFKIRIWGHLLFAGIACKIYLLMPSNFDEKIPFDYDWFCPLKTMAFINLKALPSANTFHCFLREITVYFSDEVFSLRFRGYFKQQCGTLVWSASTHLTEYSLASFFILTLVLARTRVASTKRVTGGASFKLPKYRVL